MAAGAQEKSLPATQHHLKKARERGQVATSAQFVAAAVSLAVILWLCARLRALFEAISRYFEAAFSGDAFSAAQTLPDAATGLIWTTMGWLLPILFLGAGAGITANIVHKGGLIVSFEPIAPDANRIAVGAGISRVFSRRNLVNAATGLLGLAVFVAAAAAVTTFLFPRLLNSPLCGAGCSVGVQLDVFGWLLAVGVIALVVAALADLPLQKQLFETEMRMTPQEAKQEARETEGSPEMRRHRRQTHQALARAAASAPTLVVARGGEAVGLRYHATEAPVPMVVARGRDEAAQRILRMARAARTPIFVDPALTQRLMATCRVGGLIPESEFRAVAPYIVRSAR